MEFDEQEEQEEEMGMPAAAVAAPTFDSLGNLVERSKIDGGEGRKGEFGSAAVRYRECQKNHAVSFGGNAVDGCCEYIAAGEDGTLEAVICAACNCHRNFHRKEIDGEMTTFLNRAQPPPSPLHHHQFSPHYQHSFLQHPAAAGYFHHHLATPPMSQHRPLALPATSSGGGLNHDEEDMSNPSSGGGGSKKRFRTKFTQEQKDKMLAFAEQVGWRIQKHDESALEQFCAETNVKRNVLRVWMHNNKNTLGKKP